MTLKSLLERGAERLESAGVGSSLLDARLLLEYASGLSRTAMAAHPEREIRDDTAAKYDALIARRAGREPLAYIIGSRAFYDLDLKVVPGVLVPRQETELLVDAALDALAGKDTLLDLCCGSGAIGIAVAEHAPGVRVYASDISDVAVNLSKENGSRFDNYEVRKGDLFAPFEGMTFDVIVSNPPYIPTSDLDMLQPEVAEHEPRTALDGGFDGLDFYGRIFAEGPKYLASDGALILEIGVGQSAEVAEIARLAGADSVTVTDDYGGIPRVVTARFK
ncbi:MAG: peptide chain release factor N(5)-glutamine methyltransferase [Abditibacteriota bacterium]|nr:peptide chain release factor N(5)-glutamine methyltransferase [Abditibacteriota bacterium]